MYKIIPNDSSTFPQQLLALKNNPKELYCFGNELILNSKAIAVVGSRHFSDYGRNVVLSLVAELASLDFTIVSGLAQGIDTFSHQICLKLSKQTIGVLGFGINYLKDFENVGLCEQIIEENLGAIVSPFSPQQKPEKWTFISRNKVIAGMSVATLVIEAVAKSGTFHTVDASLELSRPVFAVPGSIFSHNSKGVHKLIKQGAYLTDCLDDIVQNV